MSVEQLPLFVYGTLLPDQPNAYLWGDGITKVETAVFRYGRLYDFIHYPMLLETKSGEVKGALVTVKPSVYERTLALLDDLEGYNPAAPPRRAPTGAKNAASTQKMPETFKRGFMWAILFLSMANHKLPVGTGLVMLPSGSWTRLTGGITLIPYAIYTTRNKRCM